jgi:hypothetical protein
MIQNSAVISGSGADSADHAPCQWLKNKTGPPTAVDGPEYFAWTEKIKKREVSDLTSR